MKEICRGITAGTFDLLHAGHVAMFEEAKSVCDHLTVAIQIDPSLDRSEKNSPVQTIVERQIQVKAIRWEKVTRRDQEPWQPREPERNR